MGGQEQPAPGRSGGTGADASELDLGGLMQGLLGSTRGELESETIEGVAGGGAVRVTMLGDGTVSKVKLAPAAVDPADIDMLEELIVSALADAQRQAQAIRMQTVGRLADAFGLGALGLRGED